MVTVSPAMIGCARIQAFIRTIDRWCSFSQMATDKSSNRSHTQWGWKTIKLTSRLSVGVQQIVHVLLEKLLTNSMHKTWDVSKHCLYALEQSAVVALFFRGPPMPHQLKGSMQNSNLSICMKCEGNIDFKYYFSLLFYHRHFITHRLINLLVSMM